MVWVGALGSRGLLIRLSYSFVRPLSVLKFEAEKVIKDPRSEGRGSEARPSSSPYEHAEDNVRRICRWRNAVPCIEEMGMMIGRDDGGSLSSIEVAVNHVRMQAARKNPANFGVSAARGTGYCMYGLLGPEALTDP